MNDFVKFMRFGESTRKSFSGYVHTITKPLNTSATRVAIYISGIMHF